MNKALRKSLRVGLFCTALVAATALPAKASVAPTAKANTNNTCEIVVRSNGQFVRQTDGTAGEISIYVDGVYATYIPRKNRLYYATSDSSAVVRGYDANGIVC